MTFSIGLVVSEMKYLPVTVTCIVTVVLSLGRFAELGGCTPILIFNRQGQMKNDSNRNRVNLTCREDGIDISASFWNGTTLLNPGLSALYIHDLTPDTEAELACSRQDGVVSERIGLAALPEEQNLQDNPLKTMRVYHGEQVELPCDYRPGNLGELYSVLWSLRENGSENNLIYGGLPFGDLLSIDEDTFTLTVTVDLLEQTGYQLRCIVNVQLNTIDVTRRFQYLGTTIELKVVEVLTTPTSSIRTSITAPTSTVLTTPTATTGNSSLNSVAPIVVFVLTIAATIVLILWIEIRKRYHDDEHIYESISLHVIESHPYDMTTNHAYIPGTSASATQQNEANHGFIDADIVAVGNNRLHENDQARNENENTSHYSGSAINEASGSLCQEAVHEEQNCTASHEATDGDELRDSEDQSSSNHEGMNVYYQGEDDCGEQQQTIGPVEDYEQQPASGPYERVEDYEQQPANGPYERIHDYEQQQASGPYERVEDYEQQQASGPYERIEDYEQQQASGPYERIQVYEQLQASGLYDQVQDYEQHQANGPYDWVQGYEQLKIGTPQDQVQNYEKQLTNKIEPPASGSCDRAQDYEQQPVNDPYAQVQDDKQQ